MPELELRPFYRALPSIYLKSIDSGARRQEAPVRAFFTTGKFLREPDRDYSV